MKLLVDENLSPALVQQLAEVGAAPAGRPSLYFTGFAAGRT